MIYGVTWFATNHAYPAVDYTDHKHSQFVRYFSKVDANVERNHKDFDKNDDIFFDLLGEHFEASNYLCDSDTILDQLANK